jgi:hypothetical protein
VIFVFLSENNHKVNFNKESFEIFLKFNDQYEFF